jgi:enoyl-CoA hydratase/carnithine racemase
MTDELADALDAFGHSGARACPPAGRGPDFSFGGDILTWPEMNVQDLCFGGGFELALRADVVFAG